MELRFHKKFQQASLSPITYRVELHGPTGTSREIYKMSPSPVVIRSLAVSRDEHKTVQGSELVFSFLIPQSSLSHYDDLFASDYRDWKLRYYNDDTSALLWEGYIQPESLDRTIVKNNTAVTLTATDALKDLSELEFNLGGVPYTGRASIMSIIKDALKSLDINLNFLIKLGTYETTESATELALLNSSVDRIRFSVNESGRTKFDSCLDVIEKVLQPFYCTLMQSDGKWRIVALNEGDTYNYSVDWTTLVATRIAASDIIDVNSYKFSLYPEKSLLAPIKIWEIVHRNRNLGTPLVDDLDDFDFTGPYSIGYTLQQVVDGALKITKNPEFPDTDKYITLTNTFPAQYLSSNDFIKVSFLHKIIYTFDTGFTPGIPPRFRVSIYKPDGSWYASSEVTMNSTWQVHESPNNSVFKVDQTGNYNIKIEFIADSLGDDNWSAEFFIKDIDITKISTVEDGETSADVTFDTYKRLTNTGAAKVKEEKVIYFGDSVQFGDIGAIYINSGNNNSTLWNRYGKADNKPIIELLGQLNLNDRQRYIDFLDIEWRDPSDVLRPDKILLFQGKYYTFNSYEKDVRHKVVRARMIERIYTDASYTLSSTPLTSIDGVETTKSQTVSTTGDITDAERTNWNTAYTQTREWDGGATGLNAATGRASLDVYSRGEGDARHVYKAGDTMTGDLTLSTKNVGILGTTSGGWARGLIFKNNANTASIGQLAAFGTGSILGWLYIGQAYDEANNVRWYPSGIFSVGDRLAVGKTTVTSGYKLDVNGSGIFTGNIAATGEVTAYTSSDRRLKTNIADLNNATDIVNRLNPVTYNWNKTALDLNPAKDNRTEYGLIAQEVEKVLPDIVHDIYGKYKSLDYVKLIPILIQAIKEQGDEIKMLKTKICK